MFPLRKLRRIARLLIMDESQKAELTQLILETAREHGAKVENLAELEELLAKTDTDECLLSLVRELRTKTKS